MERPCSPPTPTSSALPPSTTPPPCSRLAALDSARPLTGRVLIGEIDGAPPPRCRSRPAVAIADPFQPTDGCASYLRVRAAGLEAVDREPSLSKRMLDAVRRPALAAS